MKYTSKAQFKKANYFGTGFPNFLFAKNMTGKTYMKPLKMIGKQDYFFVNVSFAPRRQMLLAYSSRNNRRRSDSGLHRRRRLVSGKRERTCFAGAWFCH